MGRFDGAYVAYRTWSLEGGFLHAANGDIWPVNAGPNESECGQGRNHRNGPTVNCSCGFHSFYEPPTDLYMWHGILGAVVVWGKVIYHSDGLRSQYAMPVALCKLPTMQLQAYDAAVAYCSEWELPWCETVEELIAEAERYADPVPEEKWTRLDTASGRAPAAPPQPIRPLQGSGLAAIRGARRQAAFKRDMKRAAQRRAAARRIKRKKVE